MIKLTLTIYVDVLFLLNLIVNYIVLASTAFISGKQCDIKRCILASAVGALYSTLIFFPELSALNILIFKIIVSFAIVFLAFRFINAFSYFRLVIIFYTINFLYGGGMYVFYRFTSLGSKMNYSNGEFYIDLPLWLIILLCIGFYFLVKILSKIINENTISEKIIKLKIVVKEQSTVVTALLDTGNALYDPISMLPVMLIEKSVASKLVDVKNLFSTNKNEDFYKLFARHNFRIIPFRDAAGNKSSIYAFKPDSISVCTTGEQLNTMLIGVVNYELSPIKEYNALLHSKASVRG